MISQATAKFQALHPTDHKLMINMINRARRRKGCPLCEIEVGKEVNTEHTELINMRRNMNLVKLRDEDKLREKRRKSKLKKRKRISWSENLTEVRLVPLVIKI
jgi:hypothetical protein